MPFQDRFLAFIKKPFVQAFALFLAVVFILVLLADLLIMPIIAGSFTSESPVPDVLGLEKAKAEELITKADFNFEWLEEGRYSSDVPMGHVLVQVPAPGRKAKEGRTILLTKSKGIREVEIPDLRGKSQRQAEISLTRAGLVQGRIIKGAHLSIPRGVVIRTNPSAGKKARVGDTVNVIISAGETTGKKPLPQFEGLPLEEVFQKLEALGFVVGDVKRQKNSDGVSGTVIEQSPKSGDYLPAGTKIDFVIVD